MATRKENFGPRLRRLREAADIGLRELAEAVDISAGYLSRIETEQHDPPAEEVIRKMAVRVGANEDELVVLAGRVPGDVEAWLLADWHRVSRVRKWMRAEA